MTAIHVPGYDVDGPQGDGAQGDGVEVWRGRRLADGRTVLLRRVDHPADPAERDAVRRTLARVGGSAAKSLLPQHTVITTEQALVVVYDYPAGGSLAALLATRQRLTAGEVVTLGSELAGALAHIHQAGLSHGGLDESSVYLGLDGTPLLADVGLVAGHPEDDLRALARLCRRTLGGRRVALGPAAGLAAVLTAAEKRASLDAETFAALLREVAPAVPIRLGAAQPPGPARLSAAQPPPMSGLELGGDVAEVRVGEDVGAADERAAADDATGAISAEPVRAQPGELTAGALGRGVSDTPPDAQFRAGENATLDGPGHADSAAASSTAYRERPARSLRDHIPASVPAPWRDRLRVGRRQARERLPADRTPIRRRILAAVAVAVALLGAVALGVQWAELSQPIASVPLPSPSTAIPSEAMSSPSTPVPPSTPRANPARSPTPPPTPTAAWMTIVQRLDRQRAAALAEDDPAALAAVDAPSSPALRADMALAAELRARGARPRGLRWDVSAVAVDSAGPPGVVLRVTDRMPAYQLVSRDGAVLASRPARADARWRVTLLPGPSGWRIADIAAV